MFLLSNLALARVHEDDTRATSLRTLGNPLADALFHGCKTDTIEDFTKLPFSTVISNKIKHGTEVYKHFLNARFSVPYEILFSFGRVTFCRHITVFSQRKKLFWTRKIKNILQKVKTPIECIHKEVFAQH